MISGSIVTVFGGMDRAKINCNRNLKILAGTLANINGAHLMVAILNFVIVKSLFSVWDLFWKQVRSCIFFGANHGLQDTRVQQSFFLRPLWRQFKYLSDSWTLIDKDCRSHQHAIFRVGAWYSAMSLLFSFLNKCFEENNTLACCAVDTLHQGTCFRTHADLPEQTKRICPHNLHLESSVKTKKISSSAI